MIGARKAALHEVTMSCAQTLRQRNIRVNLVLPRATITRMTSDWSAE